MRISLSFSLQQSCTQHKQNTGVYPEFLLVHVSVQSKQKRARHVSVKPCTSQEQLPCTEGGLCCMPRQILTSSGPGETFPLLVLHRTNMPWVERGQLTLWLHLLHEWGLKLCCRYLLPVAGRDKDILGHAGWIYQQLKNVEMCKHGFTAPDLSGL